MKILFTVIAALLFISCSELTSGPENLLHIGNPDDRTTVEISVEKVGVGEVTLSPGSGWGIGDTVKITATPNSSYVIDSVIWDDSYLGANSELFRIVATETHSVKVVFAEETVEQDDHTVRVITYLDSKQIDDTTFAVSSDTVLKLALDTTKLLDTILVDKSNMGSDFTTTFPLAVSENKIVEIYYTSQSGTVDGTIPAGMVLIESAGESFTMGIKDDTLSVSFTKSFYMDTVEVTQGLYDSIMKQEYGSDYETPDWTGAGSGYYKPVYNVNWYDAILFCNARSKAEGLTAAYTIDVVLGTIGNDCKITSLEVVENANGYRLPTEAEWEFACRGGTESDFFWGDDTAVSKVGTYAVYNGIKGSDYTVNQVASADPNQYGLYDMSGNVWEWCYDWFGYWGVSPETDYNGPVNGDKKIRRGGAYNSPIYELYSGDRFDSAPDIANAYNGFRTVRTKL